MLVGLLVCWFVGWLMLVGWLVDVSWLMLVGWLVGWVGG